MSATLSATRLDALRETERMLARPLTTVRRVGIAAIAPFPTSSLARIIARMLARHRSGRILYTTPDWEHFAEPSATRRESAPPGLEGALRVHGAAWVGAPGLDDRFFDIALADAGVVAVDAVPALARARDALCLVVPVARRAAEDAVGLAEQLTSEGRRVVLAFDATRRGSAAWARAVGPRLVSPAVVLEPDAALAHPARPLASRTLLAAAELAGNLVSDPEPR